MKTWILAGLLWFGFSSALATADSTNNRRKNSVGFDISLLSDPFPSLAAVNLGWNLLSFARITAGYGQISTNLVSLETSGVGFKLMLPSANFSPIIGINYATVTATGTGDFQGFSASGGHAYVNAGVDWTASSGFHFGAGYSLSIKNAGGVIGCQLGWYF